MTDTVTRSHVAPTTRWPAVVTGVIATATTVVPGFAAGALAVPITEDLGIGPGLFGLALSGFFAAIATGSAIAPRVVARLSATTSLTWATLAAAAALGLLAAVATPWQLALVLVLAGGTCSIVQPAVAELVGTHVEPTRLSLVTGMIGAALGSAPLLPGLLVAGVEQPGGWRTALVVGAVVVAGFAAVTVPLGRAVPHLGPDRVSAPRSPGRSTTDNVTRHRVLVWWVLASALGTVAVNSAASFFVPIGIASGVAPATAGLLLTLASFLAILVRLLAGIAADRRPEANPYAVAAMMLTGAAGLAITSIGTPTAFIVGASLTVAGGWGWTGLILASALRLLPGDPSRAGAAMQFGLFGGAALAPLSFGALAATASVGTSVLVAAGSALAASAAVLVGHRRLSRSH